MKETKDMGGNPQDIEYFCDGRATVIHADCRDAIRALPDNSIDSVVTDPPYALVSIVKCFGGENAAPAKGNDAYMRASAGFMGKTWDTGEVAFSEEFWREVLRVVKPGGHVVAFGASRGYHRMVCAIEDAGFEIRDSLMYLYGTGFPKSHNLDNKRGDLICGCETEPSPECDVRSMRYDDVSASINFENQCGQVLQSGLSERSISVAGRSQFTDPARRGEPVMEGRRDLSPPPGQLRSGEVCPLSAGTSNDGADGRLCDGAPFSHGSQDRSCISANGMRASHGSQAAQQRPVKSRTVAGQPISQDGGAWENCGRCGKPMVPKGLGTALKPAFEPIVLARKPLSEGTVAANVLRWGTGALNIDGCRVPSETREAKAGGMARKANPVYGAFAGVEEVTGTTDAGRWPANVVHDGSDEVVGAFPSSNGSGAARKLKRGARDDESGWGMQDAPSDLRDAGTGSAARFFYSAKASKADRNGSKHPTVKPVSLMEWLATLITPPGGTVLDPFAGSGTTGVAAINKGFRVILCEREAEYVEDIRRRMVAREEPVATAKGENVKPTSSNEVDQLSIFSFLEDEELRL